MQKNPRVMTRILHNTHRDRHMGQNTQVCIYCTTQRRTHIHAFCTTHSIRFIAQYTHNHKHTQEHKTQGQGYGTAHTGRHKTQKRAYSQIFQHTHRDTTHTGTILNRVNMCRSSQKDGQEVP